MLFDCCGGCYGFFCTSALAHIEVQEAMADHLAKEQESKHEDSEGLKEKEEKGDTHHKEGGQDAKTDETDKFEKSDTLGAAEVGKSEKPNVDVKAGIDTGIKYEPSFETESTNIESEEGKAKSKAKVPEDEDEDEDDDFMFEMDEDTFNFYQQAEQEAENKATEAQSKAIGSFCNIIFQTIIAALFVVKLNQVYEEQDDQKIDGTSSFSTFWILFPFLLISGCIICCFACAIFGAANLDTAMSSDDSSENGDNNGGDEEAADTVDSGASPVILTPPAQGVEVLQQKDEDESTAPVSKSGDNAGNGTAVAADTEEESAMDDLD